MTDDLFALLGEYAERERELSALRRAISVRVSSTRIPAQQTTVLRGRLFGHPVAVLAEEVDEVVRMSALTPIPDAPPWLLGWLQVGKDLLPVFDLAARETKERRAPDPDHFIALTRLRGQRRGLLLEAIEGLEQIDGAKLRRPELDQPFGPYLVGTYQLAERLVLLLSTAPLELSDFRLPERP
jgi:purine-binding chemotaxis protein CheW